MYVHVPVLVFISIYIYENRESPYHPGNSLILSGYVDQMERYVTGFMLTFTLLQRNLESLSVFMGERRQEGSGGQFTNHLYSTTIRKLNI